MAKEYAKKFYHSSAWIGTSKAYAASRFYICEICGRPAKQYVVHHKKHLTPENINNPFVALNWDNLQLLCLECHNVEHGHKNGRKVLFDEQGQVVGIDSPPVRGLRRRHSEPAGYLRVIRKAHTRGV